MSKSRRRFLAIAGLAPVALLGARQAFAQSAGACYDLSKMPLSQKSMRKAVGFVDPAPDQAKRCGTCAFFVATKDSCGTCQILSGGPTAQSAYCTSYAPKPGTK
jgi:High potential iron-sulfur protein